MTPLAHASIAADKESPSSTTRIAADIDEQYSPTQDTTLEENDHDPNLVNWDGEDDPEKPVNCQTIEHYLY
jgi:hypothetical protein